MQPHLSIVRATSDSPEAEDKEAELQKLRQVVVHLTRLSAIGTTAAMIVHEIAQPITAATNYLAAAKRMLTKSKPISEEKALHVVELAEDCLLRSAEIMHNIKNAAANKAFRPKALDLHVVVAKVMQIYSASWSLTPEIRLSSSACWVTGDKIQLSQVLANLIKNAMEASEGQSERRLTVSSRLKDDETVEIRVQDNGPGIPEPMRQKLFSAFSSTKPEGLGVGLAICRAIIEQHQGRIWAEDLPDGTAFCFTLPASPGGSVPRHLLSGSADRS